MNLKEKGNVIVKELDKLYPTDHKCYLHYDKPWQLLISTILSAQCTDDRVNLVTKNLYQKYPSLEDFASANLEEMEQDIRSTGFYHHKAKNIIASARILLEQHRGELPSDIHQLIQLPGVGRKTANVVRGHIFKIPSIVVDTHVKRVSNKLGLVHNNNPEKIEWALMDILPKNHWISFNTQVIAHGRKICIARRANCPVCGLSNYCDTFHDAAR